MTYQPLNALPGVCKVDSAYSNSIKVAYSETGVCYGRFVDMLNSRFIAGRPEKLGGYSPLTSTLLTGVCRGMKDWRDYSTNIYCGFGTTQKLQVYSNSSGLLIDITPLRPILTGALTNPVTTTSGSSTLSIASTAHGLKTGDYVQLSAPAVFNNITLAGTYFVTVTDANDYTVVASTLANASSGGSPVGGTVTYNYYRITLSSNPFSTTSGSNAVVITLSSHGSNAGDFITIAGASAVGGLTLAGEYQIMATTTNTFTVFAASNATSSTTGGGTPNLIFDISAGSVNAAALAGYGTGEYGEGPYGEGQVSSATAPPRIWFLDNYGQQLYACPYGGTIYVWDPSTYANNIGRAAPLYGAPTNCLGMFITPEQFVFAIGNTSNYMQVQWPDQTNPTFWFGQLQTPIITTANIRTLQLGSYIVGGLAVRDGTSLVGTNNTTYAFNYSGDQYVYDSTAAGRNSGWIAPLAGAAQGGNGYWMGPNEFWTWNGSVAPLPSDDIRDYVYGNLNQQQAYKCFATSNVAKKEITFWYPSINGSGEIDSNVTWHIDQGCFSINSKSRTSWVDANLFQYPLSSDANSNIWQEEFGTDANGSAQNSYVTFNPTAPAKGDKILDIMGFMPDFERQVGTINLTVSTQNYPADTPTAQGPYSLLPNDGTPLEDLRLSGRLVGYQIQSNAIGGDYRLGLNQVDITPGAARR